MEDGNFTECPMTNDYKRILLPLTYSAVFVLGLPLNGALLWSVCGRTQSRVSLVYLTNVAVADLLYVLTLPLLIVSYAMNSAWPFGDIGCKAVKFFFHTNLQGSMMFLMCLSVDRFIGVCYPFASLRLRTRNVRFFASVSVWILVTLETIPTLLFSHTAHIDDKTVCFDLTNPGKFKFYFPYGIFLGLVGFLIPFLVISVCYCTMMRVLYARAAGDGTQVRRDMRNKSVRTILAVCLMFVLCFVPYHIAETVYLVVRTYMGSECRVLNAAMISYKMWTPLVSFNCCANPLLYFLGAGKRRRELWARLRVRKSQIQPVVCLVEG